LELLN